VATVTHSWPAIIGDLRSSGFPQLVKANGTNIPISGYAFDASAIEDMFLDFEAVSYGSGNVTVRLRWYADTASTGAAVWGAQLSANTPNTSTQDVETDTLATAATTTTTHLGTTGQREHETVVAVSSLDALASGDTVRLRVYRDATNAADTMTGDAILVRVSVSYSDT
jgi:hypothetical protein